MTNDREKEIEILRSKIARLQERIQVLINLPNDLYRKDLFKCEEITMTRGSIRYGFSIYDHSRQVILSDSYISLEDAGPKPTYELGHFYELVDKGLD